MVRPMGFGGAGAGAAAAAPFFPFGGASAEALQEQGQNVQDLRGQGLYGVAKLYKAYLLCHDCAFVVPNCYSCCCVSCEHAMHHPICCT
jgi:hypothetical protein